MKLKLRSLRTNPGSSTVRALTLACLTWVAGCGDGGAGSTAVAEQQQEIARLKAENEELPQLRKVNEEVQRLKLENLDLAKLRGQVQELSRLKTENEQLQAQLQNARR
jgi:cell division protein FtsB